MLKHDRDILDRLKKHIATCNPQDLEVIPPLNLAVIDVVEGELGFALPNLLRDIYTKIGFGCFGFQCCLLELTRSHFTGIDFADALSLVELYHEFKSDNIVPTSDNALGEWPDQLIPFCSWGCHIYSCVDCSKDEFPVFGYDPNLYEYDQLFLHSPSLSSWMESLLNGEDLWLEMKALSNK